MITLFHAPHSRSSRMIALLEELGAPYQIRLTNIRRRDGTGAADAENPHPHGKVPVIIDDGVPVFETTAITCYLTDKFPQAGIGPTVGSPLRGAYLSWLAYYTGVVEPALASKFAEQAMPSTSQPWAPFDEVLGYVSRTLEKGPYLLGQTFCAADIVFATLFAWLIENSIISKIPLLDDYAKRVMARPAFARAAERENG